MLEKSVIDNYGKAVSMDGITQLCDGDDADAKAVRLRFLIVDAEKIRRLWTKMIDEMDEDVARCAACGAFIDYCQGHGDSGDPDGAQILALHDEGDHSKCHPLAEMECI